MYTSLTQNNNNKIMNNIISEYKKTHNIMKETKNSVNFSKYTFNDNENTINNNENDSAYKNTDIQLIIMKMILLIKIQTEVILVIEQILKMNLLIKK